MKVRSHFFLAYLNQEKWRLFIKEPLTITCLEFLIINQFANIYFIISQW